MYSTEGRREGDRATKKVEGRSKKKLERKRKVLC